MIGQVEMMSVEHYHGSNREAWVNIDLGKSFVMGGGKLYRGESDVITCERGSVLDVLHERLQVFGKGNRSCKKVNGACDSASIVNLIRGKRRGGMDRIVDGGNNVRQKLEPIVLVEIDVAPHDLLDGAVSYFGLAIESLMIGIRHSEGGAQHFEKAPPYFACKLGISIRNDLVRQAVLREYVVVDVLCHVQCGGVLGVRSSEHFLRETLHDDEYVGESVSLG